jgi:hypothetical protein
MVRLNRFGLNSLYNLNLYYMNYIEVTFYYFEYVSFQVYNTLIFNY